MSISLVIWDLVSQNFFENIQVFFKAYKVIRDLLITALFFASLTLVLLVIYVLIGQVTYLCNLLTLLLILLP